MTVALHGCCEIEFGGASLSLLPQRAVFWEKEKTVFVADTHFGKAETFQHLSIPVPSQIRTDLARLTQIIVTTQCERLVVLGDLIHSRRGRTPELETQFAVWRTLHKTLKIDLVRGNHDKSSGDPFESWDIECLDEPVKLSPFQLAHIPNFESKEWTLCGHLHPKIKFSNSLEDLRFPAFWQRNKTMVVPAFGSFIDHKIIKPIETDRCYAVTETEVIPLTHF